MQKRCALFIFGIVFLFSACNSSNVDQPASKPNTTTDNETFFPVTEFLKGQLTILDSMQVTPLKTTEINGKTDSAWVNRDSIRAFAMPFLTPVIDSISLSPFFTASSFLDQTINAITFTYDANTKLPDSVKLRHWDVYIDPQTGTVRRIYIVKENEINGAVTTTQMTWKTEEGCSIRTIKQLPGKGQEIKEEKMKWNFDH